jgi:beta-aspartyl-dipeptidase (metallo-type)
MKQLLARGWELHEAVQFFTSNPARFLGFQNKGQIAVGYDADLILLDSSMSSIQYVFAKGQIMKTPTWVKKGMFE